MRHQQWKALHPPAGGCIAFQYFYLMKLFKQIDSLSDAEKFSAQHSSFKTFRQQKTCRADPKKDSGTAAFS
jgi:hypothetical protein